MQFYFEIETTKKSYIIKNIVNARKKFKLNIDEAAIYSRENIANNNELFHNKDKHYKSFYGLLF